MDTIFTKEFFAGNRRRLREAATVDGPIVITAHGLLQRGSDNTFPFHQDSNFWYLTGINEPDVMLVMEGAKEFIIVPARTASREAFDGALDHGELSAISGVQEVVDEQDGWERLTIRLQSVKRVATLEASVRYIEQYGMYTNPARARLLRRLKAITELEITDLRQDMARQRMLKQPAELKAIQQAIDITIDSLSQIIAPEQLSSYQHEYELEADLTRLFRKSGADGHAFAPIIASGKRGCTLHNVSNRGPLTKGELVVLDVGAEISHYAADITRTVSNGQPTRRQQDVYEAVLAVQAFALDLLKPGADLKASEKQIEQRMGEALRDLKLIKNIDHESVRKYYPHSTSHFMGLDVHDVGDYSLPLEPGIVLTCEPGIYIPEEGIGVRIEDDILITETGHTVLSAHLPKTLM